VPVVKENVIRNYQQQLIKGDIFGQGFQALPFFVKIKSMISESARAERAAEFNQRVEAEFAKIQAGWEKNSETGEP